jgi:hypothetical protein
MFALFSVSDPVNLSTLDTLACHVWAMPQICQVLSNILLRFQAQFLLLHILHDTLVVVQGQCTVGCEADESEMEGGFPAP